MPILVVLSLLRLGMICAQEILPRLINCVIYIVNLLEKTDKGILKTREWKMREETAGMENTRSGVTES